MSNIVKQADFESMVECITNYDPFTRYIDDYTQMEQAEEKNAFLDKWFCELMLNYPSEVEICGVPRFLTNLGRETKKELTVWLQDIGLSVEAKPTKKIWTETEIKTLVQTNDKVLYGALKNLYSQQTSDERKAGETRTHNNVGFNGADAKFLSSTAEFLNKTGFLTDKQKIVVRKKLVKYTKQLTKLANV